MIVIADDLTGANANGVQLTTRGFSAETFFGELTPEQVRQTESDALMKPTSSRATPAKEAYRLVYNAVRAAREPALALYSKRIDSTLRGNLGSETDAFLDALGDDRMAIVVACFPSAGRIIVGGHLLVNGVPLDLTEAATDPLTPVDTSDAAKIFQRQTERKFGWVGLNDLREGDEFVAAKLKDMHSEGIRIVICDAITSNDIEEIADAVIKSQVPFIAVDPGVFTATLAERIITPAQTVAARRVLCVVGSINPVVGAQVALLRAKRSPYQIIVRTRDLLEPDRRDKEIMRVVSEGLETDSSLLLIISEGLDPKGRVDLSQYSDVNGMTPSEQINEGFAEIAKLLLEQDTSIQGMFTSGGDITVAAYEKLHAEALELKSEIVPLGSFGYLIGGSYEGLAVITKGGMVGDTDAIIDCADHLIKTPARGKRAC